MYTHVYIYIYYSCNGHYADTILLPSSFWSNIYLYVCLYVSINMYRYLLLYGCLLLIQPPLCYIQIFPFI